MESLWSVVIYYWQLPDNDNEAPQSITAGEMSEKLSCANAEVCAARRAIEDIDDATIEQHVHNIMKRKKEISRATDARERLMEILREESPKIEPIFAALLQRKKLSVISMESK